MVGVGPLSLVGSSRSAPHFGTVEEVGVVADLAQGRQDVDERARILRRRGAPAAAARVAGSAVRAGAVQRGAVPL